MATIRSIQGLVALVTGGASGFGEATARRLVQQGASVVLCDLPSSKGDSVARELGEKCIFEPVDVTSEGDIQSALRATKAKFHKLDIAINCAGAAVITGKDCPLSVEEFNKIMNVKLTGTFNVIRLAVSLIAKNQPDEDGQKGIIINTSGIAAFGGQNGQVTSSACEGGIVGMTLPLARDLECQGIRCCTITPGLFDTPLLRSISEKDHSTLANKVSFPKRLGKPEEYANFIQYIIENPMLNGCVIRLDGALRM